MSTNRVRRGPGAYRRQRQARKELERLFMVFQMTTPEARTVQIIYRKRRAISIPPEEVEV